MDEPVVLRGAVGVVVGPSSVPPVMRLIAPGYTYKDLARRLDLSVKTVETHISAALRKLQLSSRHELTR